VFPEDRRLSERSGAPALYVAENWTFHTVSFAGMTKCWPGLVTPAKAGVHVLQMLPYDFDRALAPLADSVCFSVEIHQLSTFDYEVGLCPLLTSGLQVLDVYNEPQPSWLTPTQTF
jgi:hypothetical protein